MQRVLQICLGIVAFGSLLFHSFFLSCIVAVLLLVVFTTGIPCILFVTAWTILYTPSNFWLLRVELIGGAVLLALVAYIVRTRFLPKDSLYV